MDMILGLSVNFKIVFFIFSNISCCTHNKCLLNNGVCFTTSFLIKFSTTFTVSLKCACRNEQVFIWFVLYLDDNAGLTILRFRQLNALRRFIGRYC